MRTVKYMILAPLFVALLAFSAGAEDYRFWGLDEYMAGVPSQNEKLAYEAARVPVYTFCGLDDYIHGVPSQAERPAYDQGVFWGLDEYAQGVPSQVEKGIELEFTMTERAC